MRANRDENVTAATGTVRGVTFVFVVAMLLLLGIGAIITRSTLSYQRMSRERTQVRMLMLEMRDLLSDLQNAETGQRGYLLTGDEQYLSPYLAARDSIPTRLNRISELAHPYRSTTLDIQRLSPLITNILTELAQTIAVRREQGFTAAQQLVQTGDGKRITDDIHLLLDEQGKEIENILQQRILESETNSHRALLSSSWAGVLSMTLLIISFVRVRREIRGRQQAEEKLLLKEHNERLLQSLKEKTGQLEQANQALASREAHLRAIIENEPECVKLLAADGTLLEMNAAGLSMIEADSLAQVQNHHVYPLIVAEYRDAFRELTEAVVSGQTRKLEFEIIGLKGGRRWLATHASPLRDATGKVIAALGITRDITERKQTEAALRAHEQQLRLFVEHSPAAIAMVDMDMRYLLVSNRWFSDYRLGSLDVIGRSHYDIFPEIPERWKEIHRRCLAGAIESNEADEFPRADGTVDWVRWEIRPWHTAQGDIGGLFLFSEVLTERKRAEEKLWQSEAQLRLALDASNIGLWDWDMLTNEVFFSREWKSQIGYVEDELSNHYEEWVSRVHPDDLATTLEKVRRFIEDPCFHYEVEFRLRHKNGSYRWIFTEARIFRDTNQKPVRMLGCHIDITERKLAERQIEAFATLGRRLNAAPDAETAARIIAKLADELFGWDACKLDLYDANTDLCRSLLTMDIVYGRRQDVAPAYSGEPPSPRMRRVMLDGPMLILRENPSAEMSDVRPFGDTSRPSASIMFVPVTESRKVIGTLSIQSYKLNAYTQADLAALQDLADHCAGALERLRGRDALRASEANYRTLVESASDGILVTDTQGRLMDANAASCRMFGRAREELLVMSIADIVAVAETGRIAPAIMRLKTGEMVRSEWQCRRKDGTQFPSEISATLLPDGRILGILRDITERKEAEARLHATVLLYRGAITGAGAVPYDYDYATRRYTFIGAEIEGLTGYRAEEFCGPLWKEIAQENIPLGDAAGLSAAEATQKVLRGEISQWRSDVRIRTLTGGICWLSDVSVQKLDAEGRVVGSMGILQDITERKQAEQKLAESSAQLRALLMRLQLAQEEERVRVARDIHDELGQLLTGLKMDVRWLERKLADTSLPRTLNPLLDRAVAASALADQTIAVVQKIAADLRPGVLDRLGLGAALKQRARRFEERTGVSCKVAVPETEPPLLTAVATELFYVAQEALTNVTRHAQATEVQIHLEMKDDKVVLEVCDNGRGITQAELTTPQSLGLLGMRERAAHCGGTIVWERCVPQGTRLTVRIPRGEALAKTGESA